MSSSRRGSCFSRDGIAFSLTSWCMRWRPGMYFLQSLARTLIICMCTFGCKVTKILSKMKEKHKNYYNLLSYRLTITDNRRDGMCGLNLNNFDKTCILVLCEWRISELKVRRLQIREFEKVPKRLITSHLCFLDTFLVSQKGLFTLQTQPFYTPEWLILYGKTTVFGEQNGCVWNVKRLLLQNRVNFLAIENAFLCFSSS